MKITKIEVYQVNVPIPFVYRMSGGRTVETLDDTIVRIETDDGAFGVGESCPWGPQYVPAFAEGVRAGLSVISPSLIGCDPRCLSEITDRMDRSLAGHPYVKQAIDVACWDILGKVTGLPVYMLLGGRLARKARARIGISSGTPEEMLERLSERRLQGYSHFSIKVGGDADQDIERLKTISDALAPGQTMVADANGGWRLHEALRVLQAMQMSSNLYIEQPCATYGECLSVRRSTSLPISLDECIVDIGDLMRAHADNACDVVNIKASRVGGITKSRQMRDLCLSLGMAMYIMDTGNTELGAAVTMHLTNSTPECAVLGVWNTNDWRSFNMAEGAPIDRDGYVYLDSQEPGLGLTFNWEVVGEPVAVYI